MLAVLNKRSLRMASTRHRETQPRAALRLYSPHDALYCISCNSYQPHVAFRSNAWRVERSFGRSLPDSASTCPLLDCENTEPPGIIPSWLLVPSQLFPGLAGVTICYPHGPFLPSLWLSE